MKVQFNSFACDNPVVAIPLAEKTVFFHWFVLVLFLKINWPQNYGFIFGLSIIFHWLYVCLYASCMLSLLVLHFRKFWSQKMWIILLCFSFPKLFLLFWITCNATCIFVLVCQLLSQVIWDVNRDCIGFCRSILRVLPS